MHYSLAVRAVCEMIGTAILILFGNGAVANVDLKGTKGYHNGWILIAIGYGVGVMIPVLMFGPISGAQINPAMTLGLAVNGLFPWSEVLIYIIAQLIGAMLGQIALFAIYYPFYKKTEDASHILGTCSTIPAGDYFNGFIAEFFGTFLLVLGAMFILNSTALKSTVGIGQLALGFLVCTLVASLGGPTGPGLNPARDLGPRIVHSMLPLANKGKSQWAYAWIPVVAPIAGSMIAVFLYKMIV
ncbi:MIP/aquaporin family protein [Caproicibacter sp.]|uniref:MIP/aquaporin family protein n=1 Tax=Caproicibacter sp. TaxID=2814884 RepID=UPI0039891D1A